MTEVYDLCIVGAGMIGSSAARHASSVPGLRLCVVGPEEPQQKRNVSGHRDVFGAHYDEGRITRSTDTDPVWSILSQNSIARYRDLERLSGIHFYDEVGFLVSGTKGEKRMRDVKQNAKKHNLDVKTLSNKQLVKYFPYLNMPPEDEHILEFKNAGYISARNIVTAQLKVATQNGCRVIRDVARDVKRRVGQRNYYIMEVSTEKGQIILANKVLLATGAFTNFKNILGADLKLDISLCPLTVAKVEVSATDAEKIRNMPAILYYGKGTASWTREFPREDNDIINYYMLPAVKYPDGKYYLKLGHRHGIKLKRLETADEAKEWFCGYGDANLVKSTALLISDIVKGIKPLSIRGDSCVVVDTPSGRPYIDMLHSQLGVATGGNGQGAKSCDEIGRIAAMMVVKNTWDTDIPRDALKVQLKACKSKL